MGNILDKIKKGIEGLREVFISPSIVGNTGESIKLSPSDIALLKETQAATNMNDIKGQEGRFFYDRPQGKAKGSLEKYEVELNKVNGPKRAQDSIEVQVQQTGNSEREFDE